MKEDKNETAGADEKDFVPVVFLSGFDGSGCGRPFSWSYGTGNEES